MSNLTTPDMPGSRVVAFFGMPGSGKTYRSRQRWQAFKRVVSIDTQVKDGSGQYGGMVASSPGELATLLERWGNRERFRITYRGYMPLLMKGSGRKDRVDFIEAFFLALAKLNNYLLIVEEADKVMDKHFTPTGIYSICHHGRVYGQALSLCARRPANVPRDLTATCNEVWAWPVDEPPDIAYMKARGFNPDELNALTDYSALVKTRPEGQASRIITVGKDDNPPGYERYRFDV